MAASAIACVGVAERAPIVVASHAALRARVGEMLRGENGADLPSLRQSPSNYVVTARASQTLARAMVRVAETDAVGASLDGSRRIRAEFVAGATRRKITRLRSRGVALITSLVRTNARGDALGGAAPCRSVAGRATFCWSRQFISLKVLRVVELYVKTEQPWKNFKWRTWRVKTFLRVADQANQIIG